MNNIILKLFGQAIVSNSSIKKVQFATVNKYAVSIGYLVHPDLCTQEIMDWLQSQKKDYNSTFYKSWNAVISKSRFELFIDQLRHYASTYGTGFTGVPYIPEGEVSDVPPFTEFKVISPITEAEVLARCEKMLFSGIALKQETIEDIFYIFSCLDYSVDIELVRNKEAKMIIYSKTGKLPADPVEMVRYLVYVATGSTLLIKDNSTIDKIKNSNTNAAILMHQFGLEKLSSVFYRFKPIFLAFKPHAASTINKIRKLAVKNHVPKKATFFETILTDKSKVSDLQEKLKTIGNFKKITLLQAILIRLKDLSVRAFAIRNQRLYMKPDYVRLHTEDEIYLKFVYDVIYTDLVVSLKSKACKVKIPKGINITLPTSEKSFIGNYPLGTSFDFSESDNIIGINWKGEDGADDLDLKLIDINGKQYGWDASFYNDDKSIVFSGDMTSADPEATELFYTSKGFNPSIVKVNLYNGASNSKFKFFVAREKIVDIHRNYMVNPANIVVNVDCIMDSKEKCFGVITDKQFILAQFRTGNGRVADGESITNTYTEYALNTLDCYLPMNQLLIDAGFEIVKKGKADIDMTNLSKDTLISLLS